MSTATLLQMIGTFVVGWVLGGFLFVAPDLIKSVRERRMAIARANRFLRK